MPLLILSGCLSAQQVFSVSNQGDKSLCSTFSEWSSYISTAVPTHSIDGETEAWSNKVASSRPLMRGEAEFGTRFQAAPRTSYSSRFPETLSSGLPKSACHRLALGSGPRWGCLTRMIMLPRTSNPSTTGEPFSASSEAMLCLRHMSRDEDPLPRPNPTRGCPVFSARHS